MNSNKNIKRVSYLFIILFGTLFSLSVSAQEERDTPKRGEGISSFLERNGRLGRTYYKEFLKLNEKRLNGKKELRLGMNYLLPPLRSRGEEADRADNLTDRASASVSSGEVCRKKTINEPLFGKALSRVEVTSNRLQGACFYVVSGHGGPDPGAIGKVGKIELHEDEYAYDVALRLARNLMQEGAEVRIIIQDAKDGIRDGNYLANSKRETCMGAAIPLNQVARLQQRCAKINELYRKDCKKYKYCRAIFLHVDSRSKRQQTDVFFYHALNSPYGKRLATTMKKTFESKYGKHQPNRGFTGTVSSRNLYVLSNAAPVSVFVELGNIQNTFDQRRFVISSNRQALAKWLMEGFITDYQRTK
ncbi:N-acetylmuramoyl-L-alanine amidase [Bacteroides sp.]|uniref:N-acetylmuramoyl-L-alanine amidase family protein n=1 Tax=Bacteroides sp. TaxID=29523 RepID=UPI0023CFF330|nr:N-acetylmuramoyl-L-alanine amidase [Bacteroides sp.]MDE5711795.1 N-acetylmuramoyl-L-alanine amidase [Bacteroides sp.]MDE5760493.1 N-acetylmuramoyl-L-alanine amidase [Bacteroides sp.]MDE6216785.1 N-acetylmuramoyl-L-alanine amidase [Bacteroides sp.]